MAAEETGAYAAWIGLGGVIVGVTITAGLTFFKEWWFHDREMQKEREYLAILVSAELDRYSQECASVVGDDGLCEGRRDEQGCLRTRVALPTLQITEMKVEWKALPVELMYSILDLPNRIAEAKRYIDGAAEHAFPPDFEEAFEARQEQHARLGLKAGELAKALRALIHIQEPPEKEWGASKYMREQLDEIEKRQELQRLQNQKWSEPLAVTEKSGA
ncbi:MAG TPA: hypothetical protein VN038_22345 [Dyadobacter sp.]|nr:hypothetical protein [Dyadobacter sp.]